MEKSIRMAKTLDTILKILFWLAAIAGAALIIFWILILIKGSDFLGQDSILLTGSLGNGISFRLPQDTLMRLTELNYIPYISISMVIGLLEIIALLFGIHTIRKILKPMKEGTPFASTVSSDLRVFGWFMIIADIVISVMDMIGKGILARFLASIMEFPNGTEISVEHRVTFSLLIIGIFALLFSYIFRYGEELQTLSDETL